MSSDTNVTLINPEPGALDVTQTRLDELEQHWSRFLDTSDITRINKAPGQWVAVSSDTIVLIQTMQLANHATAGSYDPTYLHQLLSTGYTASIDDPSRITIAVDSPSRDHTVHDVRIDVTTSSVMVPMGLSLDPGGIGKGFAADLVVTELLQAGTEGALVSVGGDIAAAGRAATPDGWTIRVEDPNNPPATLTMMAVTAGGVATSSTRSRRWTQQGAERHHVIDPLTGATSRTDLAAVTVIANAGWLAEAHATAALLCGAEKAIGYLESRGLSGIAVGIDRFVRTTPDLGCLTVAGSAS